MKERINDNIYLRSAEYVEHGPTPPPQAGSPKRTHTPLRVAFLGRRAPAFPFFCPPPDYFLRLWERGCSLCPLRSTTTLPEDVCVTNTHTHTHTHPSSLHGTFKKTAPFFPRTSPERGASGCMQIHSGHSWRFKGLKLYQLHNVKTTNNLMDHDY